MEEARNEKGRHVSRESGYMDEEAWKCGLAHCGAHPVHNAGDISTARVNTSDLIPSQHVLYRAEGVASCVREDITP